MTGRKSHNFQAYGFLWAAISFWYSLQKSEGAIQDAFYMHMRERCILDPNCFRPEETR